MSLDKLETDEHGKVITRHFTFSVTVIDDKPILWIEYEDSPSTSPYERRRPDPPSERRKLQLDFGEAFPLSKALSLAGGLLDAVDLIREELAKKL